MENVNSHALQAMQTHPSTNANQHVAMVVSQIPTPINVFKLAHLDTIEMQLDFVSMIAASLVEEPIISHGIVRPNAPMEHGDPPFYVLTIVLHCHMVILLIGIATPLLIDPIPFCLPTIIHKLGSLCVLFLH